MALIVAKQREVDSYYNSDRVNQSTLKELGKGFSSFLKYQSKKEEEVGVSKPHFVVGSAVDTILTGEPGQFEEKYFISDFEFALSEVEIKMITYVFDELVSNHVKVDLPFNEYMNMIANAALEYDWYKGKPGPKRTEGFIVKALPYFEMLKESYGKEIITVSQNYVITKVTESLKEHETTKNYFDVSLYINNPNVDIYYQLPIYYVHEGVECKALLDMMLVFRNPETHKIESIQPIDLKTMSGETIDFLKSVKQWRYDIQAAWYTVAVKHWMKAQNISLEGCVLKPFQFIVQSTTNLLSAPLIFEVSSELLHIGQHGRHAVTVGHLAEGVPTSHENIEICWEIKGFKKFLEEFIYYSNQGWVMDKRVAENDGVYTLDWEGLNL